MFFTSDDPTVYAVLGFSLGIYAFFKGFGTYRKYRVLADTPEMPIRSIPMGLVEIHGQAQGDQLLTSPVTHTPCCLYKVEIEKWKTESRGRGGSWSHHRTDIAGIKFYLTDATGKVLVEPRDAELDLPEKACRTVGRGRRLSAGRGASEEELLKYVTQADLHRAATFVEHGLEFLGACSDPKAEQTRQSLVETFQHTPGTPEFQQKIMTFILPKMQRRLESMGTLSDPEKELARLATLEALKHPPGSPEFVEKMKEATALGDLQSSQKGLSALQRLAMTAENGSSTWGAASGSYRFTEYCVVPGQAYDITGTCVENPEPKDEHDRNLIMKGQNEPTFLISWQSEKELESTLRWRATLGILGGAALSIACLAFLLYMLGFF